MLVVPTSPRLVHKVRLASHDPLYLVQRDRLSSLEGTKTLLPQFILLTHIIVQIRRVHPGVLVPLHALQLRNHIPQPKSLAHTLSRAGFQHDVDDVHMEMVVGRLVVDVAFELIGLDLAGGEDAGGGVDDAVAHLLEPGHVALLEVAQRPDVAPLHQGQQVHALHGLAVPVEVRQEQETRVRRRVPVHPRDHVLLLRPPV